MASLTWGLDPATWVTVDYSIADGSRFGVIRCFAIGKTVLFDEAEGIEVPGWKDQLLQFVHTARLNDGGAGSPPYRTTGHHAFVLRLAEDGEVVLLP